MPREEPNPEFSSRLTDLVGEEKNRAALARALGVHRSTVDPYLDKGRVPKWRQLLRIAARYRVTTDWLLTGREPKGRGEPIRPVLALRVLTLHEARRTLTPQEIKDSWAELPLVGEAAAAGEPLREPGDKVEDWLLAPKRWVKHGGYACVRVRGRSMLPVLGDGDIVAVNLDRRDPHDLQGKMAAVRVPDEGVTVKYIQLIDEALWLFAPNIIEWRPKPYKASDIQIIGAVEWAWRRFK